MFLYILQSCFTISSAKIASVPFRRPFAITISPSSGKAPPFLALQSSNNPNLPSKRRTEILPVSSAKLALKNLLPFLDLDCLGGSTISPINNTLSPSS
jgi:hypothetical protein